MCIEVHLLYGFHLPHNDVSFCYLHQPVIERTCDAWEITKTTKTTHYKVLVAHYSINKG